MRIDFSVLRNDLRLLKTSVTRAADNYYVAGVAAYRALNNGLEPSLKERVKGAAEVWRFTRRQNQADATSGERITGWLARPLVRAPVTSPINIEPPSYETGRLPQIPQPYRDHVVDQSVTVIPRKRPLALKMVSGAMATFMAVSAVQGTAVTVAQEMAERRPDNPVKVILFRIPTRVIFNTAYAAGQNARVAVEGLKGGWIDANEPVPEEEIEVMPAPGPHIL